MKKADLISKTALLRAKIEQASAWTDDADALEMVELFPHWVEGKGVIVGAPQGGIPLPRWGGGEITIS